ncbi:leucyl/phenylalanyl-tRNA--protein transferase [Tepidiforma sp.]|uniref:leucyl/phenylalanyl-tRNA--protein transferase n=1 Tax=Tepidiforma sp. TaxID=2682230 RepID=UPI002ADDEECF|nr:leucyl/phenylalanyl-tRNA--protein transferase [Tepidiforma sp.]
MPFAVRDSRGKPCPIRIESYTQGPPQPVGESPWEFPDPRGAAPYGLVAEGGAYLPSAIVAAYRRGIFPWPHEDMPYAWFSPDPRAILPLDGLRVSRRLGRTIRSGRFWVTVDRAFTMVLEDCADRLEGTWIIPAYMDGYVELHRLGWAHSFEVWLEEELVGGLYGIAVGAMFGAESMFSWVSDASKVAMAAMVQHCRAIGVELIDVQVVTPHTARMGAVEISREEYLERLAAALQREARWWPGDGAGPSDREG